MADYVHLGSKHINSFGSASQFWADYYYAMYRDGTKMFYRLKTVMTYKNTSGGSGYYNDPVVAIFKMNYDKTPKYDVQKTIKSANNGMMNNGYTYTAESDWFSLDKTSGNINCLISINNSNTWGFDSPDYYFSLGIIPALSTILVNNGVYFDVDKGEGVPNTVPVVIKKYDDSYTTKLKITSKNNAGVVTTIREYQDFNADTLTFTEEELQKYYASTPDWKMTILTFYLETFTSGGTSLGVFTDDTPAKVSDTDLKPTFNNFTYSDNNPNTYELTKNRSTLIRGYSDIRMSVGGTNQATAHKGSSIKKYTFMNGSQSVDYNMGEYPAYADLTGVTERTLTVWAIDSRDESTKAEKLATNWVDYTKIEKLSFSAERNDGGTSSIVTLKLEGKMFDGRFGLEEDSAIENSIKNAIYKYKKTGDTEWIDGTTELNVIKNGNTYTLEQQIRGDLGAEGFDVEESYDIYIEVSDQLSTVSDTIILGAGSPALDIYGNCIALGQAYDESLGGRVQILGNNAQDLFKENNAISIGMFESNQALTDTSNSGIKVNLNKIIAQNGTSLSFDLDSNSIVIGKKINQVLISALLTVNDGSTSANTRIVTFGLGIKNNDTVVAGKCFVLKPTGIGGNFIGVSLPPILINFIRYYISFANKCNYE